MSKPVEITRALSSIDWTPPGKDSFSEDFVIEAFLKGKEVGERQQEKILREKFVSNLNLSGTATEELIARITEMGFTVKDVRLAPAEITVFNVLVMVKDTDFQRESFLDVYSTARDIKARYTSSTLYISFSFMAYSNNLNESRLSSDGYTWKYGKKIKRKTKTRAAQ